MKSNRKTLKYKFITSVMLYLKETWKNKLVALALVAVGMVPYILERDVTFLIFMLLFAIPLFITVEDVFYKNL